MQRLWMGGKGRLLLAAFMTILGTGYTHAALITISLVPTSSTVQLDGVNDPLIFDVLIANPDEVSVKSWSLDFFYDPAVFQPLPGAGTVPTEGFELGPYISNVVPQWNPNYEKNGIAPDVARGGAVNFGSSVGSAPTGLLAKVAFDAVGLGDSSEMWLNGEIMLSTGAATGVVFEPAQVTVVPEPITFLGMMLGCGWVLGRRRRAA